MKQQLDYTRRDTLCGITEKDYDIARFMHLSADTLQTLVDDGYADLDENQNGSPNIEEYLNLMKEHPGVEAHGYVVSPSRDDTRVSIEGLMFSGYTTLSMAVDFANLCRHADTFDLSDTGLYCWFD